MYGYNRRILDNTKYIQYSDSSERKKLDLNVWDVTPQDIEDGITQRHLYFAEPRRYNVEPRSYWRDPVAQYQIPMSDIGKPGVNPDVPSRFRYENGCPNGYCFGQMPGKYNDNPYLNFEEQPANMAPCRLYDKIYLNGNIPQASEHTPTANYDYKYDIKYKSPIQTTNFDEYKNRTVFPIVNNDILNESY